ncbi:uncharacterized protein JCM6883_005166 [Sporobolomyces salmoneus]|uniref:uncharacterized protein n=1 Tax=Sporobolomyces salmoneus TaxID=183962 RepID=UPI00317855E4
MATSSDRTTLSSQNDIEKHHEDELTPEPSVIVEEKSKGVVQIERFRERIDTKYRIALYGSFTILAYILSLDQYTTSSYLSAATSVSFNAHSTLTTISSIRSVFQAVSQPPIAKISDYFGRLQGYALCVVLYAVGRAITAASPNIYAYAVGNSIYILGITGLFLLQNIIIADISSLRNRLFWSIFPSIPGVINVWISGNVTQAILGATQEHANRWRWGMGMFAIMSPILTIPVMLTLGIGMRKSRKETDVEGSSHRSVGEKVKAALTPKQSRSNRTLWQKTQSVFWQLDLLGLLFFVAGFGMILVTVTIANGRGSHWSDGHCIALLVCGGVSVIAFGIWERFGARHPLIPFSLLTNRTVIICFLIAIIHPASGGVIGSYFYTYVLVAADQTTLSATRITSLAGFVSTLMAACSGIAARYIRYLKPIIIFGFCVEILAFGLMIRYRGAGATQGDLAAVQVVRGLGVGAISFPLQASIQSVTKHEHLGAITAAYLTIFYLSQGVGSAIGGGIWTNLVPEKLNRYIPDPALAARAYSNPLGLLKTYAPGTPVREAISRAHGETQRVLSITGTVLAVIGLLLALGLEWVKLTDDQTLKEVENREDGKLVNEVKK